MIWQGGRGSARLELSRTAVIKPLCLGTGNIALVAPASPVRISSRATPVRLPETVSARAFSCSMWHGARRSEMGRVAPRIPDAL